jgi:threonine dehydrogenase-like Zn-dependent dehydrogenase
MVVEAGEDVKGLVRGDMVAVKPVSACGVCGKCQDGKQYDCENGLTFGVGEDGMLRDFAVVQASDAVKLPERVSVREATFIDLIDIAIETVSRLNMDKGQYLVISGATELGIILAQVAIYYQIIPILIDIDPVFLQIAAGLGIYYTVNSTKEDTKKRVFSLTGGRMADGAAYITAGEQPLSLLFDCVRRGGCIALCGYEKSKTEMIVNLAAALNKRFTVIGITEGNNNIKSAVNMLANRTVTVEPLIGAEIDFDQVGAELTREPDAHASYLRLLVKA